jgi:uncharacterized protein (DUF952 family)
VCEFWLGHVALGRASVRDREAEFEQVAWLLELEQLVARTTAQVAADLEALSAGRGTGSDVRAFLPAGGTDESLVLHVIEELYQHLGHMESAVDALAHDGALDERLWHLASADDWERALAGGGPYEMSTVGRTLSDEGFIHCSFADQVAATARRFYAGRADVVVLEIDPARLTAPVRVENLDGGEEQFPHLYGPLPIDAVLGVVPLAADGGLG